MRSFASDNFSGAHPAVLNAIAEANRDHARSYGADPWTEAAVRRLRELSGCDAEVFFVFNGTAANVLALRSLVPSYGAVICPSTAHINVDECGAPEDAIGCKLLTVNTCDGKLRPADLKPFLHAKGNEHHAQPWAVAISQPTEVGTLYSLDELRELVDAAHGHGLVVYMDGARIGNAVAALGCSLGNLVSTGVDAFSFGGTKNGLLFGEAVVFPRPGMVKGFPFLRKQSMQLFSKMRFVGAQFNALLADDLWIANARNSNAMASLLEGQVEGMPEVKIIWKRETNAVFARIPAEAIPLLQEDSFFYVWDEEAHIVRWMTSWDTVPDEVIRFRERLGNTLMAGNVRPLRGRPG